MMSSVLFVTLILVGLALAAGFLSSQMKKNWFGELERKLDIADFEVEGFWGRAYCSFVWKGYRVAVEALPVGPGLPSTLTVKMMQANCGFTADIEPGPGLRRNLEKQAGKQEKEEEAFRPWRARLTEEEKEAIRARGGVPEEGAIQAGEWPRQPGDEQLFKVVSPNADRATAYLGDPRRREALEALFRDGFGLVQIGFADISAVKSAYKARDMHVPSVEGALLSLRALRPDFPA